MPLTQPDHPTSLWWPHPHTLADVVAHETRTSRDARVREYVRPCRRENPSAWAGPFVFPSLRFGQPIAVSWCFCWVWL